MVLVEKVVSGGQTGVDRAGLEFAIRHGIPHGGWVPRGRLAEDGRVPDRYQMKEHGAPTYPPRTEANVRDSDATVIFTVGSIQDERGCLLTASLCVKHKKPFAVVNLKDPDEMRAVHAIQDLFQENLLKNNPIKILNVAGARGSRNPDLLKVDRILERALA